MRPLRYTDHDEAGVLAVAHRGGAGCRPENSLAAFRWSYDLGLRWLETDVRVSRDGVPVLHHDRGLQRLFGLDALVRDLTWDELRGLRTPTGERLLRPADVLEALPEARLAVDVKDPDVVPGLIAELRRVRAVERVCLAGAADAVLAAAVATEPGLHRALGWRSLVRFVAAARLGLPVSTPRGAGTTAGAAWAHVPDRLLGHGVLSEPVVARARRLGLRVLAWTVDDPARMHELLDLGVSGIITDRPDLLREVLVARGRWQGPGPLTASAAPTLPRWQTSSTDRTPPRSGSVP